MLDVKEISRCKVLIDSKKYQIKWCYEIAQSASRINDIRLLNKMKNLADEYMQGIKEQEQILQGIQDAINTLPDDRMKTILNERYFDGLSWDAISKDVCISLTGVYKLHDKAIKILKNGEA